MKRKSSISSQSARKKPKASKSAEKSPKKRKRSNSIDTTVSSASHSTVTSRSSRRSLRIAAKRAKENGYELEINTDKIPKRGSIILEDHLFEAEFGICLTPSKQGKTRKPTPHPKKIVKKSELVRKIAFDHSGSLSESSSFTELIEKSSTDSTSVSLNVDETSTEPIPVEPLVESTKVVEKGNKVELLFWLFPMIVATILAAMYLFYSNEQQVEYTAVDNSSKGERELLVQEIKSILLSQSQQILMLKDRLKGLQADFDQL